MGQEQCFHMVSLIFYVIKVIMSVERCPVFRVGKDLTHKPISYLSVEKHQAATHHNPITSVLIFSQDFHCKS